MSILAGFGRQNGYNYRLWDIAQLVECITANHRVITHHGRCFSCIDKGQSYPATLWIAISIGDDLALAADGRYKMWPR